MNVARSNLVQVAAFLAAALLVATTVGRASTAAFTGEHDNTGNAIGAGALDLDGSTTAMFNVTNLVPGQSVERCIRITYTGTIDDANVVKVFTGGITDTGNLRNVLDFAITEGSTTTAGSCTGFAATVGGLAYANTLADFASRTNYSNGVGTWDPASSGAVKDYRIVATLQSGATNAEQGKQVTGFTIRWQTESVVPS